MGICVCVCVCAHWIRRWNFFFDRYICLTQKNYSRSTKRENDEDKEKITNDLLRKKMTQSMPRIGLSRMRMQRQTNLSGTEKKEWAKKNEGKKGMEEKHIESNTNSFQQGHWLPASVCVCLFSSILVYHLQIWRMNLSREKVIMQHNQSAWWKSWNFSLGYQKTVRSWAELSTANFLFRMRKGPCNTCFFLFIFFFFCGTNKHWETARFHWAIKKWNDVEKPAVLLVSIVIL